MDRDACPDEQNESQDARRHEGDAEHHPFEDEHDHGPEGHGGDE